MEIDDSGKQIVFHKNVVRERSSKGRSKNGSNDRKE